VGLPVVHPQRAIRPNTGHWHAWRLQWTMSEHGGRQQAGCGGN